MLLYTFVYSSLFSKHRSFFLPPRPRFLSRFHFYFCRNGDTYSLCSSLVGEDLPTHPIRRHFVAKPVRHTKKAAKINPFVLGRCIGYPSYDSEKSSFFFPSCALWTQNCSRGVKWCLAPDCCCSHCHVCRLCCAAVSVTRVQRDAEREGSSLRGVLWFYWSKGSVAGKVLSALMSRNVTTECSGRLAAWMDVFWIFLRSIQIPIISSEMCHEFFSLIFTDYNLKPEYVLLMFCPTDRHKVALYCHVEARWCMVFIVLFQTDTWMVSCTIIVEL